MSDWANSLTTILNLNIPWEELCPYLADLEPDQRVSYSKFLERYQIHSENSDFIKKWQGAIIKKICIKILAEGRTLGQEFKNYDIDGTQLEQIRFIFQEMKD